MRKILMGTIFVVVIFLSRITVEASNITYFGVVDKIDHTFGAGGGSFSGQLEAFDDDAWLVFSANTGDELSFQYDGDEYGDFVVFAEMTNGVVEVGDVANVLVLIQECFYN